MEGKAQQKVRRVMAEFAAGTLRSSSGARVTKRTQAIAIGLSEGRRVMRARPRKPK